jgi:hypothetical protein
MFRILKLFFVSVLLIGLSYRVDAVCPNPQPSNNLTRMCIMACNLDNSLTCKSSGGVPLCTPDNVGCNYLCVEHATLVSGVCTCDLGYHANGSSCIANNIYIKYNWDGGTVTGPTEGECSSCNSNSYTAGIMVPSVANGCRQSGYKLTGFSCKKTDTNGTAINNSICDGVAGVITVGSSITHPNTGCDNTNYSQG